MTFSWRLSTPLALILTALSSSAPQVSAQQPAMDPLHAWAAGKDPAVLEAWVNARLAEEAADLQKLLAVTGPRTVENTLRPFDDAQNQLALANNNAYLAYSLGDAVALRDKGQALTTKISSANTDLNLNTKVYSALAAVPLPANDPATRHYLERTQIGRASCRERV